MLYFVALTILCGYDHVSGDFRWLGNRCHGRLHLSVEGIVQVMHRQVQKKRKRRETKASTRARVVKKSTCEKRPFSAKVERLREILKFVGVGVSPLVYVKAKQAPKDKQEEVLIKELEKRLAQEGLSPSPSKKDMRKVKTQLERKRDLEDIECINIIEEPRRSRTSTNNWFSPRPNKYADQKSEDEDQGGSDQICHLENMLAAEAGLPGVVSLDDSNPDDEHTSGLGGEGGTRIMKERAKPILDLVTLTWIVERYHHHFSLHSRGRKKAISQLIPENLWKDIYVDYKKKFPNPHFQEDSMKECFRRTLRDISTGTTMPGGIEKTPPQTEDLLDKIMSTDSHKTRNVLKSQFDIMDGPFAEVACGDTTSSESPFTDPLTDNILGNKSKSPLVSRSQDISSTKAMNAKATMFPAAIGSLESMAKELISSNEGRTPLIELLIVRNQESEPRKDKLAELNFLKSTRDLGIISEDEFRARVKEML